MKQSLLAIIPLLIVVTISNVYASGPRLDYDERYVDVPGAPECWVDGYDAGFAGKYDEDRANECADIPGDQYNASWGYGCIDSGLTTQDCDDIKENENDDLGDHEQLKEENTQDCYDDGYEDGQNNPFDQDRNSKCREYGYSTYYDGFIAGCEAAGNTKETCSTGSLSSNSVDNSNDPDRLKVIATLNVPSTWCEREFVVTLRTESVSFTEYKDGCTGDVEFAPAPIGINEDFTVCAQASNGAAGGCQSGINGPESEPERITIDVV
ncbi:MAG: hypothetical protein ACRD8W_01360 [Nitrososphaeraceae archaeon]